MTQGIRTQVPAEDPHLRSIQENSTHRPGEVVRSLPSVQDHNWEKNNKQTQTSNKLRLQAYTPE